MRLIKVWSTYRHSAPPTRVSVCLSLSIKWKHWDHLSAPQSLCRAGHHDLWQILDELHKWIMNSPAGEEGVTRGSRGVEKKKSGSGCGCFNDCPRVMGPHDTLRQLLSLRRSITFIISALTVHQPPDQTGFWLVIDLRWATARWGFVCSVSLITSSFCFFSFLFFWAPL